MARSRGIKEYLPPVRGLNTSLSPRQESAEFFTDGVNMRARFDPMRVEPRKGITNIRVVGIAYSGTTSQSDVNISFGEWRNPNNDKNKSFVWVKNGTTLFFYDVSEDTVLSTTLDLNDALSGTSLGTTANLATSRIEGSTLKGNLLIVGEAINPVLVKWDGTNISAYVLNILVRDMLGIDDGLDVDERPNTLSEKHEYNLYNQGWYKTRRVTTGGALTDPILSFKTDQSVYPSNADISHLAMVDNGAGELVFDSDFLKDLTFGNTQAPRGHYVLDGFDMNREARRANPEVSDFGTGGSGSSSGDVDFGGTPPTSGTYDPNDDVFTEEP